MLVPLNSPDHIECPNCRRHTVVRHGESEYVCLNCGFRRDLSSYYRPWGLGYVLVAVFVALMVMVTAMS